MYLLENTEVVRVNRLRAARNEIIEKYKDFEIETCIFVVSKQLYVRLNGCRISKNFHKLIESLNLHIMRHESDDRGFWCTMSF